MTESQDTGGRTKQLSGHPETEGLLCQGKEFVFYLKDNRDLLKVVDLGNDMVKIGNGQETISVILVRKPTRLFYSPGKEQKEDK